jgi:hypothetical protein
MTAGQMLTAAISKTQQVNSFTGQVNVQGTGEQAVTLAGTITEQVRPLLASANFSKLQSAGQNLGPLTEVLSTKGVYLKMPMVSKDLGQALGAGSSKPWFEFSSASLSGSGLSGLFNEMQNTSPLSAAQLLSGATNAKKLGTSTLNGVQVTELQGSEPASAALAKLPSSRRSTVGKEISSLGVSTVGFTVWVDGQNLIRKQIVTEKGSKETITTTATVTSVNQPVSVSVPPSSQVTQIPASALSGSGA